MVGQTTRESLWSIQKNFGFNFETAFMGRLESIPFSFNYRYNVTKIKLINFKTLKYSLNSLTSSVQTGFVES